MLRVLPRCGEFGGIFFGIASKVITMLYLNQRGFGYHTSLDIRIVFDEDVGHIALGNTCNRYAHRLDFKRFHTVIKIQEQQIVFLQQ
ncbi:MAG: hypothetical protein A3E00_06315 [Curvibacter sp. RIFCSPHIGHO2_12_FULL_63_18]|nr:MAG: hypothetical protein A2037_01140 [Curvibacter sp. GWA2_63_95]OGO98743.1 MAG: hypothetical protein A3E00_06315 [Curvibacter sp. RIFCSPHIGHO2_12_FULL_63_18]